MAEQITTLGIGWSVELGDLKKQLEQVPNITDEQAAKMVNRLESQWKRANKAAAKALKDQQKTADATYKNIGEGAKNAATAIGGSFGAIGGQVENALKSLGSFSEALGPVGTGVLLLGAAVGGVALGLYELGTAAVEAQKRLTDAGKASLIPADARKAQEDYAKAMKVLRTELDVLITKFGSAFIPFLTSAATNLAILIDKVSDWKEGLDKVGDALKLITGYAAIEKLTDSIKDATGATMRQQKALNDLYLETEGAAYEAAGAEAFQAAQTVKDTDRIKEADEARAKAKQEAEEKSRKAAEATAKAQRKLAEETSKAEADYREELAKTLAKLDEVVKANHDLQSIHKQATDALLTGEDAINQRYDDQLAALDEVAKKATDLQKVQESRVAIEIARERELADVRQQLADEEQARMEEQNQAKLDNLNGWRDAALSIYQSISTAAISLYDTITNAAISSADAEVAKSEELQAKLAEIEGKIKDSKGKRFKYTYDGMEKERSIAGEAHQEQLQQQREDLRERLRNQRKKEKEAKKHAIALWKTEKAMKLAAIPLSTAAAIAQGIAMFGPPPSPAGIAAIASATALGATELVAVATSKPPQFHIGYAPDEQVITKQVNEAVLTPRATQNLGADTIKSLNNDTFNMEPPVVHVYIDSKEIASRIRIDRGQKGMAGNQAQRTR